MAVDFKTLWLLINPISTTVKDTSMKGLKTYSNKKFLDKVSHLLNAYIAFYT